MSNAVVLSDGPEGGGFSHNDVWYEILPTVFSGKSIKAVKRAMVKSDAEIIVASLRESGVPDRVIEGIDFRYQFPEIEAAIKSDPDAIAAALSVCCTNFSQLGDKALSAAMEFVDSHNDVHAIGMLLIVTSGVDEAGKSGARDALEIQLQKRRSRRLEKLDQEIQKLSKDDPTKTSGQNQPEKERHASGSSEPDPSEVGINDSRRIASTL